MYIINGIAYAGEPTPTTKVIAVAPQDDYKLLITFFDGEQKLFDFEPLLNLPCFIPLKDKKLFNKVYIDYGCAVWNNGEIDIAPEKLYYDSVPYIETI